MTSAGPTLAQRFPV